MNIKNQNIVMEIKELDECNSVEEENIEDNCEEIISSTNVDGLLIGGASLNPETFTKIYNLS